MRKLEESFPDELVVIGVHSPKFSRERSTDSLQQAVLRLGVKHPVVSDRDMDIWDQYAVRAWPTLILVDPAGRVIGKHSGEVSFDEFQPLVDAMLAEFRAKGMMDRRPIPSRPMSAPETPLLFPGKVLADEASGRLFVADTGHHRIVVAGLDGMVQRIVGGRKGFQDGADDEAAFDGPQGMALDGEQLYLADTGNHAVRRLDLATWRVTTVAGTGELGRRVKEGPGQFTPLRSPWGLSAQGGVLYIAMAGSHQLWVFDPISGQLYRYAGSGREALVDGSLARATFAQPSGLSSDGRRLYVADSETSAIRVVDLPGAADQVRTLVGQGLFDYGDADGTGDQVRLQHPLDVAVDPARDTLYIADSYNNKVKQQDLLSTRTLSLLGDGRSGLGDGGGVTASFWEPEGLSLIPGRLYVADTNNHAIRVVDLSTLRVSTLTFPGLP